MLLAVYGNRVGERGLLKTNLDTSNAPPERLQQLAISSEPMLPKFC